MDKGSTPLMYACQQGEQHQVINIIKNKPGCVGERERSLKSALHYCCESGEAGARCAAALVSVAPHLVPLKDQDGYTALHLAVIAGNLPLIRLLISKGAHIDAVDNEGHTSVHWATVCGEMESLEAILEYGGNPDIADMHGGCPVHYAAQMCGPASEMPADVRLGLAALNILLDRGADPNPKDNHGRQPILWAASAGSSDAILALVNAGANVEASDNDGLTALHCAASRGHTDCVETLISLCGAGVDVIDTNGCSALFYSVTLGHADVTQLLLNHGANTNHQDRKGRTAVHCGAAKGQLETLKVVAGYGGNTWQRTVRGDYPLHDAVASGRRSLVMWLLEQRPDAVNSPNNDGRCPLHVAAIHNNTEMCKTLLDAGSLVNPVMRTSKGDLATPLDAALHKGYRGCAKYLQLHGGVPASRLNSHFAALRGPKNRQDVTALEPGTDHNVDVNKESIAEDGGLTISRRNEILMTTPKAKILQVFVEDEVEIRRIRCNDNSSDPVKYRHRKKKTKHVSGKDYDNRWDYKKRLEMSSDEDSCHDSDASIVDDKYYKQKKWNKGPIVKYDEIRKHIEEKEVCVETTNNDDGLEKNEEASLSYSTNIELEAVEKAVNISERDQNDSSAIPAPICDMCQNAIFNEDTTIKPDSSESVEHHFDNKDCNTQIVTAIVHKEPERNINVTSIEDISTASDKNVPQNAESIERDHENDPVQVTGTIENMTEDKIDIKETVQLANEKSTASELEDEPPLNNDIKHEENSNNVINLEGGNEIADEAGSINEEKDTISGEVVNSEKNVDSICSNDGELVNFQKDDDNYTKKADTDNSQDLNNAHSGNSELHSTEYPKSPEEKMNVDDNENTSVEPELIAGMESINVSDFNKTENEENGENEENDEKKLSLVNDIQPESEGNNSENDNSARKSENDVSNIKVDNGDIPIDDKVANNLEQGENKITLNDSFNSDSNLMNTFGGIVHAKTTLRAGAAGERHIKEAANDATTESSEKIEGNEIQCISNIEDFGPADSEDPTSPNKDKWVSLQDSEMLASPSKSIKRSQRNETSKIPRPCKRGECGRKRDDLSTVSVTQAVQLSMRKYHMERRIFHHLLELKRLQIRAGRASEGILVKRLVDDYSKAPPMMGLQQYNGPYTFAAFEKYLYEQLRLLQTSGSRLIPQIKSSHDLDRLMAAIKKTKAGQDLLTTIPRDAVLCTLGSHRCYHATHAYTGVPCAAYISRQNHHTMPKSASNNRFLPKIVNDENHAEVARTLRYVDPSRPLTLELNHGSDKQIISLPTEKLDKNKRYFVTFTVRGGEQLHSDRKHTHASSL